MLHLFQLLSLLIDIDQEIVPNLSNIKIQMNPISLFDSVSQLDVLESQVDLSLGIFKFFLERLLETLNLSQGLSLLDIEEITFFILFIRFIILSIRYNLKTSFYINSIGFVAGYLWYLHLIDLISIYRNILLKIPFLENLGLDGFKLREYHYEMVLNNNIGENIPWYDLFQLIYYAFAKNIVEVNPETNVKFYIDPLSMMVSNFDESTKIEVIPIYYKLYNQILPQIFDTCSKFWNQLSGIAAYGLITRIGKRYCPYLVRWHWTFLLVVSIFEPFVEYFVFRMEFFQQFVLIPQLIMENLESEMFTIREGSNSMFNLLFQINTLNVFMNSIIIVHIGLVLFAFFHAIWGQYFYLPFLTENVELHIGPRPKNSIYSGGNTAWQDKGEKENNLNKFFPKLWYGWFGRGTIKSSSLLNLIKKNLLKIKKRFK